MSKICQLHPTSPRYRYKCLECHRKNAREWNRKNREHCRKKNVEYHKEQRVEIASRKKILYQNDPEKYKVMARRSLLKNKYGISLEEYEKLFLKQKGVCAICKKPETCHSNKRGPVDSLRVDHCHKTGKNRGLLCSKCNFGIGQFNDDIELLINATKYLKKYKELKK